MILPIVSLVLLYPLKERIVKFILWWPNMQIYLGTIEFYQIFIDEGPFIW